MRFFGTSPRAQPEGECLKNHRFDCEVRSLLFAAESKKQGQKGPFLTAPDASKNTVFETPWQKRDFLVLRSKKRRTRRKKKKNGTKKEEILSPIVCVDVWCVSASPRRFGLVPCDTPLLFYDSYTLIHV